METQYNILTETMGGTKLRFYDNVEIRFKDGRKRINSQGFYVGGWLVLRFRPISFSNRNITATECWQPDDDGNVRGNPRNNPKSRYWHDLHLHQHPGVNVYNTVTDSMGPIGQSETPKYRAQEGHLDPRAALWKVRKRLCTLRFGLLAFDRDGSIYRVIVDDFCRLNWAADNDFYARRPMYGHGDTPGYGVLSTGSHHRRTRWTSVYFSPAI
ncbi:hypothetical protein MKZ38_010212 [Zalerion maritima]|uniref:Uncharacterized protein n=1 Tax=Zalerion maritima TaxID=339359 RepID=A0AAD5WMX9_9PEZI|nr:hypothetical protein MKZ38_010212 [Zalerion maritima]